MSLAFRRSRCPWVKQAKLDSGARRDGLTSEEPEELARLGSESPRARAGARDPQGGGSFLRLSGERTGSLLLGEPDVRGMCGLGAWPPRQRIRNSDAIPLRACDMPSEPLRKHTIA